MRAKRRRMYAVSRDGVGLIAGTLSYSRRQAIETFCRGGKIDWGKCKAAGYRTVKAVVEIVGRFGTRRTTRRI